MDALSRPPRRYLTTKSERRHAKDRRDRLSQLDPTTGIRARCINENDRGTHGAPTHGVRCAACHESHMRSR